MQTKSSRTKKENFAWPNNFWRSCEIKQDQYFCAEKYNLTITDYGRFFYSFEAFCVYQFGLRVWSLVSWKWKSLRRVWLFATPYTMQSVEFSRPEYWSGYPSPFLGSAQPRHRTRVSCIARELFTVWATFFLFFFLVHSYYYWSSVQFNSVTQSCPTLCDPMNRSTPGLPVHHQLPELTQTHVHRVGDAIQPSHPLLSPSPPAPNPSQHQGLFQWINSLHGVAKLLEFQLLHQSF